MTATRLAALALGGALLVGVGVAPGTAQEAERLCDEVLVEMSDGVRLHTWVSRLPPDQPRPVLLEIESYARPDNGCPTFLPGDYYPDALAPEVIDRFTLVHVSYRGTGSSEGEFDMTGPDSQRDVREVIRWAASQPWSTGDIVLTGQSGTGFAAHHGLTEPAVKAAVIYTSCADMYRCFRRGGLYNGLAEVYLAATQAGYATGQEARGRLGTDANPAGPQQQAALADATAQVKARTSADDWWADRSALEKLPSVDVPVLYTSEPYDIVQPFDAYQSTPNARLVLGLGHTTPEPIAASDGRHAELVREMIDRFVRHHGLGDDVDVTDDPPVVVVINTGSVDTWRAAESLVRYEDAWPLPDTDWTRLSLDVGPTGPSSGSALATTESLNDGQLASGPGEVGQDPIPLAGSPDRRGDLRTNSWLMAGTTTDFRDDERAALTYTSPPLVRDLEVTGPIALRLVATATAADVDWSIRLTDVWPDGRSEWITDGYLRASLRHVDQERSLRNDAGEIVRPWLTFDRPEPVPGGEPVEYLLELIPTSNVFRAGHRLRLDVLPAAASDVEATSPAGSGTVLVHRGPDASSLLVPVIPGRCQDATPLGQVEPVSCAASWAEAIGEAPATTDPDPDPTTDPDPGPGPTAHPDRGPPSGAPPSEDDGDRPELPATGAPLAAPAILLLAILGLLRPRRPTRSTQE